MTGYEFTTIKNGRSIAVVVESSSVERAADVLRRTMGRAPLRFVGVAGHPTVETLAS